MRKTITFLFVLFCLSTQATHISSANLHYRYIGDSTGIFHHYEVSLDLYRDTTGAPPPASPIVRIQSSCYASQIVTMTNVGTSSFIPGLTDCTAPTAQSNNLSIVRYRGTIILPGKCADYKFYWSLCCRPPSALNIYTSNNRGIYVSATLNNFIRNNSSARSNNPHPKSVCINQTLNWNRQYSDANSTDSIFVMPDNLYESTTGSSSNLVPYDTGYSILQPLDLDTAIGYQLDYKGNLVFKPTQIGHYDLGFKIQEFTYDTTFFIWLLVSERHVETNVLVSNQCSSSGYIPLVASDTLTAHCFDDSLFIKTSIPYVTSSMHISDFEFFAPDNSFIPVTDAYPVESGKFMNDSLILKIHIPIDTNGHYRLLLKTGSDNNSLLTECGGEFISGTPTYVKVIDCSGIGIQELETDLLILAPNPATSYCTLINPMNIQANFILIDQLGNQVKKGRISQSKETLDLSGLTEGVYYFILENDQRTTQKLIILK